ncbi:MAG: endonuclease NucS domain-containing protein [Terriglobales bacterium]
MYKLNKTEKQLTKLKETTLSDQGLLERFDFETWIAGSPGVLGEDLLVLATEYVLPSNLRIDILALDKSANIVVVELKRDQSGSDIEWQAIRYASYCSNLTADEIYAILAKTKMIDTDAARDQILQFIDEELEQLNNEQRIILVAGDYHPDVASAVLWLREYEIDVRWVRIPSFVDAEGNLFLNPEIIIPLPEAEVYTTRVGRRSSGSSGTPREVHSHWRRGILLPQNWRNSYFRRSTEIRTLHPASRRSSRFCYPPIEHLVARN